MASLSSLMRSVTFLTMVLAAADGFVQRPSIQAFRHISTRQIFIIQTNVKFQRMTPVSWSVDDDNNNNNSPKNEDRLRQLGYREDEIRRSQGSSSKNEEVKVRVDLIDDVDPVSLTAIGFALIALNFLVFANLGDGGISGVVATIINSF
jgi:hypothetical protein